VKHGSGTHTACSQTLLALTMASVLAILIVLLVRRAEEVA
jgi:hypothetical protein